MLRLDDIRKAYGGQTVLDGVTFQVNPKERVGLIGRNGGGKTTLLRLILGFEEPDAGSVTLTPGTSLGYLAQDVQLESARPLHDELLSVFADLLALESRQRELEVALGQTSDEQALLAFVEEHDALRVDFERLGGYTIEAEISKVMNGLGFTQEDRDKPVNQFSGGWQMRVGFAKLLLQAPDVLLLDEPTNHLDLQAVEWLAEYLQGYKGSLFVVSHDRWLLDRVCTHILALDDGTVTAWTGNYSAYLAAKAQQEEAQAAAYQRQQEYLSRQEAFIARFRAKPSKTRATQSREKLLDKMERIEAPSAPERRLAFQFPSTSPSGRETMLLRRVSKAYGGTPVFDDVTFSIERGDRVALIGPNGAGKTTLLRLLARDERPDRGSVTYGHNVRLAFYTQHQAESLDTSHTVYEAVHEAAPDGWSQTDLRSLLGRLLFRGEDVFKLIAVLSGGERSRVALAKLLLRPTNVLLLDEPTNHLDIPAREVLEEALAGYKGAFVIATHDRYLLDHVTNKVIEVKGGHVAVTPVGYREYVASRGAATTPTPAAVRATSGNPRAPASPPSRPSRQPSATSVRAQLVATEHRVEALEAQIKALEDRLADADLYRDPDGYSAVLRDHEEARQDLETTTARWEELAERVAALS